MADVTHKHVWHWSHARAFRMPLTLRPSPRPESLEGVGLSVSIHPLAWQQIAKLGGAYLHRLSRRDGNPGRFVQFSSALERRALAWGVQHGYLTATQVYRVAFYDSELDEERFFDVETREEAQQEADDNANIKPVKSVAATPKLLAVWLRHFPRHRGPLDAVLAKIQALNLYVAATQPSRDGIWWDERLDPAAYSAPRGVILPHALARWQAQRVSERDALDVEE